MKNRIFITLLITIVSNIHSQLKNKKLIVENNIKVKNIAAFEYDNGLLVKEKYHEVKYDKNGNELTFTSFNNDKSIKAYYKSSFSEDGLTEHRTLFDSNGKIKTKLIYIKNLIDRSYRNLQISKNNDTLVHQLRYKDIYTNDSILYWVENGKRKIMYKWFYNSLGQLNYKKIYNKENGELIIKQSYKYYKKKNCLITRNQSNKIISHKCYDGKKTIQKTLRNSVGYLYGIKIKSEKKGKRIETKLDNGLIEKIEYYSKRGEILSRIEFKYVKY